MVCVRIPSRYSALVSRGLETPSFSAGSASWHFRPRNFSYNPFASEFFVGLSADLERPVCIGSCAAFQDVRGWLGYRVGDVSLYVGGGVYQSIDYSIVSPLTSSPSRAILGTGFNWSFSSKESVSFEYQRAECFGCTYFCSSFTSTTPAFENSFVVRYNFATGLHAKPNDEEDWVGPLRGKLLKLAQ
jgi:hypothetical protein